MIVSNAILMLSLAIIVLVVQLFIPIINIGGIEVTPDILIILLTYIGFYYGRFEAILIGFLFGIVQDFSTQLELIGAMSLIKSIIGYCLGTLALYRSIWSKRFRLFIIFLIYSFHFIFFQAIAVNGVMINKLLFINIILIQALLCFFILIIIDKSIIKFGVLN